MEGSSKPETVPTGLGRTSAMSVPLLSDRLERLHSQTDSFLVAARLVRRGWTEEGKKKQWHFSYFDRSAPSEGHQDPKHAEIGLKEQRSRQVPIVTSRRTAEDGETRSGRKANEAKQTTEGSFSTNRHTETQMGLCSQPRIVCVWGPTCRQSRRFKAPLLPVIAEM